MPRTIEERLQEVLESIKSIDEKHRIYTLVTKLLADFKAEGIAHRIIHEA